MGFGLGEARQSTPRLLMTAQTEHLTPILHSFSPETSLQQQSHTLSLTAPPPKRTHTLTHTLTPLVFSLIRLGARTLFPQPQVRDGVRKLAADLPPVRTAGRRQDSISELEFMGFNSMCSNREQK